MQFLYSSPAAFTAFNPFTFPCFVLLIALILLFQWSRRPRLSGIEKNLLLPPGSMGWPYVGETLKLFTQNPNFFFSTRQERYGDIFKTHILGCRCVMITNPEAAKIVLVKKADLFKPTYPPTKEKMIGAEAIFFHQGPYHSKLKKLIISSFSPSAIKDSVSDIEDILLKMLPFWVNHSINTEKQLKMLNLKAMSYPRDGKFFLFLDPFITHLISILALNFLILQDSRWHQGQTHTCRLGMEFIRVQAVTWQSLKSLYYSTTSPRLTGGK